MTAGTRRARQPVDAWRFETPVRDSLDMVFATAVRLVSRTGESEDVAQTVFLRAFERFEMVSARGGGRACFFDVASSRTDRRQGDSHDGILLVDPRCDLIC